jgi:HlyD family secretion protein
MLAAPSTRSGPPNQRRGRPAAWRLSRLLFAPVLFALGATACHRLGAHDPGLRAAFSPRAVSVAAIQMRRGGAGLSASGYLVARDQVDVGAEVAGYRVIKLLVDEGAVVAAGQPLAVLDDSLLRAQIAQQSALAAQQATLVRQAQAESQRAQSVQGKGVMSDEALQARVYKAEAARSAALAQQAQLQDLEVRRAHLIIRAPCAGLVLERNVQLGDLSTLSSTPMFRIAKDSQIELEAQAAEDDLYRITVGDPADVTLSDGAHLNGVVRKISPRVDPQTKLGAVRIALSLPNQAASAPGGLHLRGRLAIQSAAPEPAPEGATPDAVQAASAAPPSPPLQNATLRVGAFAAAQVAGQTGAAPWAPEAAVRYDTDGASVMVLQSDNRVRKTPIKTGAHSDGFVQLLAGPPAGAEVLLGAAAFVVDGEAVQPVRASP